MRQAAEAVLFDAVEGETGLRSLRACRKKVETELRKFLQRTPGQHDEAGEEVADEKKPTVPLHLARFRKLKSALKKTAREWPDLKASMVKLADSLPEPADYEGAERTETLAMAGLVRLLPWPQRQQLLREARLLMEKG